MKKLLLFVVIIFFAFIAIKPNEITIKQNDEEYITLSYDIFTKKHISIEKEENGKITHAFIIFPYGIEIFWKI